MEFEKLLIRINEILHRSIQKYKEDIIGNSDYSDITLSQLFYLEAVYSMERPTLGELARRLNITNASASVGVQKLQKRGLIQKSRSGEDKRAFNIALTSEGEKLIRAEASAFSEFASNIKNTLNNEETAMLESIFTKILNKYS